MKADRETVHATCEGLLKEGVPLDKITKKAVTDRIGSKGNNQLVYQYINEWKDSISDESQNDEYANLNPLLAQFLHSEKESWKKKIREKEELLLQQKSEIEVLLQQVTQERDEAVAFKATFEKALSVFEKAEHSLKEKVAELNERVLDLSIENEGLRAKEDNLSNECSALKEQQKEAQQLHQDQMLHLIEANSKQREKELELQKEEADQHKIKQRSIELKLESLEEKYSLSMARAASLAKELDSKNAFIEEKIRTDALIEQAQSVILKSIKSAITSNDAVNADIKLSIDSLAHKQRNSISIDDIEKALSKSNDSLIIRFLAENVRKVKNESDDKQ